MPDLEFKFYIGNVLTDATSAVLSDPADTYGVKRNDTNAAVVANNTAMTHAATGVYRYTFAAPATGLTYSWWAEIVYNGATYRFEREFVDAQGTVPAPSGGWRYSDRAHVVALTGAANAVVIWDLDDDGTEDAGLMVQDGTQADAYIDLALSYANLTTPIDTTTATAGVVQALADIGAHLTVWWGYHHRGLDAWAQRMNMSADAIGGLMGGYKSYADEQLVKLASILQTGTTDLPSASAGGAISVAVGSPKHYPGTGSVRPAAVTVPDLVSPYSW